MDKTNSFRDFMIGATACIAIGGVVLSPIAYVEIKSRYPDYKAGTCLKTVDDFGNEFEPKTYSYTVINKVGKKNYKYTSIYFLYSGSKVIGSGERVNPFDYIDEFLEPQVIDCEELKKILDVYIKENEE